LSHRLLPGDLAFATDDQPPWGLWSRPGHRDRSARVGILAPGTAAIVLFTGLDRVLVATSDRRVGWVGTMALRGRR